MLAGGFKSNTFSASFRLLFGECWLSVLPALSELGSLRPVSLLIFELEDWPVLRLLSNAFCDD